MTDKELADYLKKLDDLKKKIKKDPKLALQLLQGAGILDKQGELTEYYNDKK